MPDWQFVSDAYARLLQARSVFDAAVMEVLEMKNAGARPALEVMAAEVEHLTRSLCEAFGPRSAVDP